jgi:hypothetical protein
MTATSSLCLSIEFDFEGERVTGWLADEQGNDWAFSSWLDLLSVIDRVLASTGSLAATTNAPDRREDSDGKRKLVSTRGR